jgi:hypothetical protein
VIDEICSLHYHWWVTIWQVVFEVVNGAEQEGNAFFQSIHQSRLRQLAETQNHPNDGHSCQNIVHIWKFAKVTRGSLKVVPVAGNHAKVGAESELIFPF